jgi:hypothetical protein
LRVETAEFDPLVTIRLFDLFIAPLLAATFAAVVTILDGDARRIGVRNSMAGLRFHDTI